MYLQLAGANSPRGRMREIYSIVNGIWLYFSNLASNGSGSSALSA